MINEGVFDAALLKAAREVAERLPREISNRPLGDSHRSNGHQATTNGQPSRSNFR